MQIKRFDFDGLHDFRMGAPEDEPEEVIEENTAVVEEAPPPPPTFSERDLLKAKMEAKQEGYKEGFNAGMSQADADAKQLNEVTAEATQQISIQLEKARANYRAYLGTHSDALSELCLMIAKRIAGEAIEAAPTANIEKMVNECLPMIIGESALTVHAHSAILPALEEALQPILNRGGFDGDCQFHADDSLKLGDARLVWKNGGAERDSTSLWQQVESIVSQMELGQPVSHSEAAAASANATNSPEELIETLEEPLPQAQDGMLPEDSVDASAVEADLQRDGKFFALPERGDNGTEQ